MFTFRNVPLGQSQLGFLVHLVPWSGWLVNNTHVVLTVPEAKSLRSECQHGGSAELPSQVTDSQLLLGSSHGGEQRAESSFKTILRALAPS